MNKQPKARIQRIAIPLFTFFWWNRLWQEHHFCQGIWTRGSVYKVKGWRTAIVDYPTRGRVTVTFLFELFGKHF